MGRLLVGDRCLLVVMGIAAALGLGHAAEPPPAAWSEGLFNARVAPGDCPQLGRTPLRNNAHAGTGPPFTWNVETGQNVKWSAPLGSQTYGTPVIANGKVFVGTNNHAGYLPRFPPKVDLGVLLCFDESNGRFLWQHSSEKLPTGRVHDWPQQGVCSAPVVEGDRLWFVTNRGEVRCLDAEGFYDGENDGPFRSERPSDVFEAWQEAHEADVVWSFDMMHELGVRQHNMANCAPTIWGDVLFLCTSNGVDETHIHIPAPDAPSFLALDKHTGAVLWTDNSPGRNILHGQWSCPAVGVFAGVPQVLFAGGDGWLYSFRADRWQAGQPELLWKFDGNPKESLYQLGGRATRNGVIAAPVIHDGLVYLAMGEDPEHGEGDGHLWCIDPTKRGDVSPELVVDGNGQLVPHRRLKAADPWTPLFNGPIEDEAWATLNRNELPGGVRRDFLKARVTLPEAVSISMVEPAREWRFAATIDGTPRRFKLDRRYARRGPGGAVYHLWGSEATAEQVIPNPNSAVVWHYTKHDRNRNGDDDFEETMHRTLGSPAIKDNLLYISDFSGLLHCLNAKTGQPHWTYDLFAACWTTPLIVGEHVYVADEDGDVAIFTLAADQTPSIKASPPPENPANGPIPEPLQEIGGMNSIYAMPVFANKVLFIASKNHLYAIAADGGPPR
jgi:outer membrane protein assembly factor BamB